RFVRGSPAATNGASLCAIADYGGILFLDADVFSLVDGHRLFRRRARTTYARGAVGDTPVRPGDLVWQARRRGRLRLGRDCSLSVVGPGDGESGAQSWRVFILPAGYWWRSAGAESVKRGAGGGNRRIDLAAGSHRPASPANIGPRHYD